MSVGTKRPTHELRPNRPLWLPSATISHLVRRTVAEGAGLLALTTLFPFQQAQPLVRYLTGDLVEVTHEASCRPGTTSIKPLGRAKYGVPLPGSDDWLVTPASGAGGR